MGWASPADFSMTGIPKEEPMRTFNLSGIASPGDRIINISRRLNEFVHVVRQNPFQQAADVLTNQILDQSKQRSH